MAKAYLLLGGNLGDRNNYLAMARQSIADMIGDIANISSVFETQPWGFCHETNFLNQLIVVTTTLEPEELLDNILFIEQQLGRIREEKHFTARTIDIDILFYDNRIVNKGNIIIPHPRLHIRRFALEPLAEVEPDLIHPVLKRTIAQLLIGCSDKMKVRKMVSQ